MKVLICGLGSIGQRHVRILKKLLGDTVEIGAVRFRRLAIVINDDMTASEGVDPIGHYGLVEYPSYDEAYAAGQQAVFVTNPISMHVETALQAARHGCHVFIEKPLAHELRDVDVLDAEIVARKRIAAVGYQLRFHPMLERVKELLATRGIGDLVSGDIQFGEWLPGMHPYEDYRESHAARADQGGGVIAALSHEIDLAVWLFGMPATVAAVGGHLSDLEMSGVEDVADLLLGYERSGRTVPVHVHLDFVQRNVRRRGFVLGTCGTIEWDYVANELRITRTGADSEIVRFDDFRRNVMFERQTENFIKAMAGDEEVRTPLADGLRTLRVCLAARRAMQQGTVERP